MLCGLQLEQQKTFGARFEAMQDIFGKNENIWEK